MTMDLIDQLLSREDGEYADDHHTGKLLVKAGLNIQGLQEYISEMESNQNALNRRCQKLTKALRQIASCDKRADGDVVDIAREALGLE